MDTHFVSDRYEQFAHLLHVTLDGDHRHEDANVLGLRQAQQGFKLCAGKLRIVEQQAHAPFTEKRIGFKRKPQGRNRLIATDVEQADRHRFLTQMRNEMLQFAEKLFFGGQLTREVELLNAQQTDTVSAVVDDGFAACVYRKIRLDRYRLVITRDSRLAARPFTGKQAGGRARRRGLYQAKLFRGPML